MAKYLEKACGLNTAGKKKTILIVEDDFVNRTILSKILEAEFCILEAENGREAWDVLKERNREIALILLDLVMPVMDGYEFMRLLKEDCVYSAIPVIVTTSRDSDEDELRCLESGATDFISKPYNPEIVKRRVMNIVRLRESASMLRTLEFDQLTGLYSKEFFYQHVRSILDENPEKIYDIICSDIDSFKLINERQGVEMGDRVLCYLADNYREELGDNGICARIGADVFAMLIEHSQARYGEYLEERTRRMTEEAPVHNLVVQFGIYMDVDRDLPVSGMCDRAMLALNRIKHQYGECYSMYDDSLRISLLKERQMLDCMEEALRERQFQAFYQPKHAIRTGGIAGAEALVRWYHPEYGFMSPGEFIPLFEKNGFITKLDFYVWEEVCRNLRMWLDRGLYTGPVSVNISRVDFRTLDLAGKIENLVDRYQIPHELLHLEVTETAYTDDPQHIIDTVNDLRERGFAIEMDDFGSGYSSLNMLSELSVDILKLDMHFIQKKNLPQDKSILSFIIGMSKILELDTIAEGVETKEQVDKLREMGCDYVQGYYYAKPMPAAEFENYLRNAGRN